MKQESVTILCKPLNQDKIKRFKGGHKNGNNTKRSAMQNLL